MGKKWDENEDALLKQLVSMHGKQWSLIASMLPGRTASQISSRWEKCIDPSLTKGPFTPEEDRIVLEYVEKYGATNWPRLAAMLGQRSPKQCRERWYNNLDPSLSRKPWTREEDLLILEQQRLIGSKWSTISKYLPGRSDNAIKNRWNSSISKRIQTDTKGQVFLSEESFRKQFKPNKITQKPRLLPLQIPQNAPAINIGVEFTPKTQQGSYMQIYPQMQQNQMGTQIMATQHQIMATQINPQHQITQHQMPHQHHIAPQHQMVTQQGHMIPQQNQMIQQQSQMMPQRQMIPSQTTPQIQPQPSPSQISGMQHQMMPQVQYMRVFQPVPVPAPQQIHPIPQQPPEPPKDPTPVPIKPGILVASPHATPSDLQYNPFSSTTPVAFDFFSPTPTTPSAGFQATPGAFGGVVPRNPFKTYK